MKKIDDFRSETFMENYKPNNKWGKISCAKKINATMMPPCFSIQNKTNKFVAKIWMSLIETSPPENSSFNFWGKLVNKNYQLLWFEGDRSPCTRDITYECEKHDGKYWMLLLFIFDCFFLLQFLIWSLGK